MLSYYRNHGDGYISGQFDPHFVKMKIRHCYGEVIGDYDFAKASRNFTKIILVYREKIIKNYGVHCTPKKTL